MFELKQQHHTPQSPDYAAHGFANRREYLESLCEDHPRDAVLLLADILGPSEDFDGLLIALRDYI